MAQNKEQIKASKIELSHNSQPIRCRIQNTGNQDAHRNRWVWLQNKGKSEGYEKWKKENVQGTNSEGKKTRTQIFGLEQKEEINMQPEQNEETRIQNNKERLRNLRDNFKRSNIWIIRVPEEEEEQKMETYLNKLWRRTSLIWQRK